MPEETAADRGVGGIAYGADGEWRVDCPGGRSVMKMSLRCNCVCCTRFIPLVFKGLAALLLLTASAPGGALQPGFDQVWLGTVDDIYDRSRAFGVGVADFNGDGVDDILAGDTFGDVQLFTGDGDGTFTTNGVVINQSYYDAFALAAGDFNNDGSNDFV